MKTRLLAVTALLLLVPLAFWLSGWHWQGNEVPLNYLLYLVTQTSSNPVVFASIAVLFALLYYTHRRGEGRALLLVVLISLGATQVGKSLLKPLIGEARPYVVILTRLQLPLRPQHFRRQLGATLCRHHRLCQPPPQPHHRRRHRLGNARHGKPRLAGHALPD